MCKSDSQSIDDASSLTTPADDILAGSANMESSYVLGKGKALAAFPMLQADGLCGAVVYYDGESSPRSLPYIPLMHCSQDNTTTLG